MRKYIYIFSGEVKKTLAYRADAWLTSVFGIFSILLAYLLWKTVFAGAESFNGFTLQQMTTYYLLTGILTPLTQSVGMLNEFSEEIRNGQFAKYIVKPLSSLGYFISASFGKALFSTVVSAAVFGAVMSIGQNYFAPVTATQVLRAFPVIVLGSLLSIVIGYLISMAAIRFTDIGFLYLLQGVVKIFLSGSMIPLNMVFGERIASYSPFSYTLYYPVMLCMGLSDVSPESAVLNLAFWLSVVLGLALFVEKRAVKAFEGVGI